MKEYFKNPRKITNERLKQLKKIFKNLEIYPVLFTT